MALRNGLRALLAQVFWSSIFKSLSAFRYTAIIISTNMQVRWSMQIWQGCIIHEVKDWEEIRNTTRVTFLFSSNYLESINLLYLIFMGIL
jgi:hypothetical protein